MIKFPECPKCKDSKENYHNPGVLVPLGFSDQIFAMWKCTHCKYTLKPQEL